MKKILLGAFAVLPALIVFACPVCEKQQPEILRGIAHGAGPEDNWDYMIVWAMVVIVLFTLFFSVKWLIRPGERSQHHIKRFILNNE
ncbi:hypothetical protein [Agriterribacter sp.]|uniref:hypothetical protein n=1 Tax=Agriterribacter sp. TaxID=2821509 RepID=UPI002D035C11|nr:hypothetical protein [Agriterribacter sp.]HTN08670.1 hypothetical protein [Agriterribacter sp.]